MNNLQKKEYFNLLSDLNNHEVCVRLSALNRIEQNDNFPMVGPLTRRLFDSSQDVQQYAGKILSRLGFSDSINAIFSLYKNGESAREKAIASLEPLFDTTMPGPHHAVIASTAAGLTELYEKVALAAVKHENIFVRRAAIEGLWQSNQEKLAPTFIIPSIDVDPMVRKYACVGLAENSLTTFSQRLRNDPVADVRKTAEHAFSHPGDLISIKDPHRKIMENEKNFCLPQCGSSLVKEKRFSNLIDYALSQLGEARPELVIAALSVLEFYDIQFNQYFLHNDIAKHPDISRYLAKRQVLYKIKSEKHILPLSFLKGKRILIIGGDGRQKKMLYDLESSGLEVIWMSGFNSEVFNTQISKLDAVIVIWKCISHAVAKHAPLIGHRANAQVLYARSASAMAIVEAVFDIVGF